MGQEKWDFNTAWDWVRPYPGIGVLYGNDDPANILGAPAYTEKEYLNEVNWKDEKGREDFQAFIDGRDVEDWKNTRFLSTLTPGMEFGSGANSYRIINGTDKRLIPDGYKVVGTLDDAYRPGYSRVSGQILNSPVKVPGVTIPGYTIIQKVGPDKEEKEIVSSPQPIDFSPRYIKPNYHYTPSSKKEVSSQTFDEYLASRNNDPANESDIRRALKII
jgi:hypothetical protein